MEDFSRLERLVEESGTYNSEIKFDKIRQQKGWRCNDFYCEYEVEIQEVICGHKHREWDTVREYHSPETKKAWLELEAEKNWEDDKLNKYPRCDRLEIPQQDPVDIACVIAEDKPHQETLEYNPRFVVSIYGKIHYQLEWKLRIWRGNDKTNAQEKWVSHNGCEHFPDEDWMEEDTNAGSLIPKTGRWYSICKCCLRGRDGYYFPWEHFRYDSATDYKEGESFDSEPHFPKYGGDGWAV